MFSFFCNISEHVGKHSGVGVGCFASDGSGKICGVLCGVQAGGKFFCFGTQLANSGRQASSSGSRFSGLRLCIFHSLITGNNAALFNNTGGGLGVDFLRGFSAVAICPFFCQPLSLQTLPAINAPAISKINTSCNQYLFRRADNRFIPAPILLSQSAPADHRCRSTLR